jgi:hypothetical protein
VDWVVSRTNLPEYRDVIARLNTYLARLLKVDGALSVSRAPEPSSDLAWDYTNAYFEAALENAFGITDRAWFESRLRAHFNGTKPDDRCWYALRNAIWAAGSRIFIFRRSGFREALHTSWGLFENALSALPDVLFFHASIIGLQALIVMVIFILGRSS